MFRRGGGGGHWPRAGALFISFCLLDLVAFGWSWVWVLGDGRTRAGGNYNSYYFLT